MSDETLRTLERRAAENPGDETAATALAVARVRDGAKAAVATAHGSRPEKPRKNGRLFLWSVRGTPELSRTTRIEAARATLRALGIDPSAVTLSWSVHAGCSTCPCSPGYVVKVAKHIPPTHTGVYTNPETRTCDVTWDLFAHVVVPASETEPKTEMQQLRDQLGIANGGR